jgi:hypothetical protein
MPEEGREILSALCTVARYGLERCVKEKEGRKGYVRVFWKGKREKERERERERERENEVKDPLGRKSRGEEASLDWGSR